MSPTILHLTFIAVVLPSLAAAVGITSVICNVTDLRWSFNEEGMSPCQVAANLGAVCSSTGDYTISPLTPPISTNGYLPSDKPTPCECSGLVYNLAAACGYCQGGISATWNFWTTNCTAVAPSFFPFALPPGTNVPHWAYMDASKTTKWDPNAAKAVGDTPESAGAAIQPSSSFVPPPTLPTAPSSLPNPVPTSNPFPFPTSIPNSNPTSAPAQSSSSNKSSNNVGAIVGGVVGGVIALGIIGGLLFYFLRRNANNNNRDAPANNFASTSGGMQQTPYVSMPSPAMSAGFQYAQQSGSNQYQPYDPNNPSTYPGSPVSFGGTASTGSPPPTSHPGYGANQLAHNSNMMVTPAGARNVGYTGSAEI